MSFLEKFLKKKKIIRFIKPYWQEDEFILGQSPSIRFKNSEEKLITKLRQTLGTSNDWEVFLTGSGRTAIELGLRGLKDKYPNKTRVILPSYSCRGIVEPVINCGLIPVFVDINQNLLPDEDKIINLLSSQTLACLAVNLGGLQRRWQRLASATKKLEVALIEDDCQNLRPGGRNNTTEADMKVYSFGIGKNANATAGGVLVSKLAIKELRVASKKLEIPNIEDARERFRYQVSLYFDNISTDKLSRPDEKTYYGFNRINPLDAELMLLQLDKLNEIIKRRKNNAEYHNKIIDKFPKAVRPLPQENNIYTKYSLIFPSFKIRDGFYTLMKRAGIELEGMYIPLHLRNLTRNFESGNLEITEKIYELVYNLPVRPQLTTNELEKIGQTLNIFGKRYG